MTTQKPWGKTELIFHSPTASVHRIEVARGGYCSVHKHLHKHNQFYVEDGILCVTVFTPDMEVLWSRPMQAGESVTVLPGAIHQFKALAPAIAYEIYSAQGTVDPEDIVRFSTGGKE